MTLVELEQRLASDDLSVRAYLIGKIMRQAKPDDALQLVSPQDLADLWPMLEKYLGETREFWSWLLEEWRSRGIVRH